MHREHAIPGQQIVEHGEDRLLDLSGIAGAANEKETALEIQEDEDFRARSLVLWPCHEVWNVDHGERRLSVNLAAARSPDEHIAGEHAVIRCDRDDADR